MGTPLPSPIFGPFLLWQNGWMHQDATWYGSTPGDFVLDGDPVPCPKRGGAPQFSVHVYCGKTAGWIKMPLGTKAGLSPGDSVLDEDTAPSHKGGGGPSPIFDPFLLWPNGWMHQDATWYGSRPQPRRLCVRWRPSPLPQRGWSPLPNFRPISLVAIHQRDNR